MENRAEEVKETEKEEILRYERIGNRGKGKEEKGIEKPEWRRGNREGNE